MVKPRSREEEWHVTVEGVDAVTWANWCAESGIKPLYIELSNFERQLMCAAQDDPSDMILLCTKEGGGLPGTTKIVRVKHEVSELWDDEVAVYYECHVKLDGPFRVDWPNASRDLYRDERWYRTRRSAAPFDPATFRDLARSQSKPSVIAGMEYEACLSDTNPGLDSRWISK